MSILSCKKKRTPEQALIDIFNSLDIEDYKKTVLKDRYLRVLENFHQRSKVLSIAFYATRMIVTVGSILVPAFLSKESISESNSFYWTTWLLSLAVSIANGIITLFKLDKKYFFINTSLEMLHSEAWQYIGLTGRYSSKDMTIIPTHENQFISFFRMAERIKMRQVEEEYWKFTDTSGIGNATSHHSLLTYASPSTQQGDIDLLPVDKKRMIEVWLEDMRKKSPTGLQPRINNSSRYINSKITSFQLDEEQGSSRIPESSEKSPLSVQLSMSDNSPKKESILQDTSTDEVYEDTFIELMPDESN